MAPRSRELALWIADAALARRLGWPTPVPLLASQIKRTDLRLAAEGGDRADWAKAGHLAYACAGVAAIDLYAYLARRADRLIAVASQLRGRPYELVTVTGGWQHRTRKGFVETIRTARGLDEAPIKPLSKSASLLLLCIACFQAITRTLLGAFFGKEVSRGTVGHLRDLGFIAAGPRSPESGAPYTYVTTKGLHSHFGFDTLRDLPDMEKLKDAGLLRRDKLLTGELLSASIPADEFMTPQS